MNLNLDKYLGEGKKYKLTGSEASVAQELTNWSNSLKYAGDILMTGDFDNAVKIVEQTQKATKNLLKLVKGLQKGELVSRAGFIDQKIGKKSTYQR